MRTQLICCLLLLTLRLAAHNTTDTTRSHFLSVQFMGMTYHPGGGSMPENYPMKLDKKAYWVANVGAQITYSTPISKRFSFISSASYYKDCAYLDAGYLHIGVQIKAFQIGRHWFGGEAGPVFVFRKDWHRFDRYKDDPVYGKRVWQGWQYRLSPIAGSLEYRFQLNGKWQIHYSVVPAYPAVINSMLGVRVKL